MDEGVAWGAVLPPAAGFLLEGNKVMQAGPEVGAGCLAAALHERSRWGCGLGLRLEEGLADESAAALVHRPHCCQAHHVPHAVVHAGRRQRQPELALLGGRGVGGEAGVDVGADGLGNGAGPVVVAAVCHSGAAGAGLLHVQAGGGGVGVVVAGWQVLVLGYRRCAPSARGGDKSTGLA